MRIQPNIRLFAFYWICLWLPLAALTGLLLNPLSTEFVKAFWNPTVWIGMIPVSGVLAWLLLRYRANIKRFWDHPLVTRIVAMFYWGYMGWQAWDSGVRKNSAVHKTIAVFFLFFVFCIAGNAITTIKRPKKESTDDESVVH